MLPVMGQQQSNMLNIGVSYDSKQIVLMGVFQYSSKKSYKEENVTPDIEKFKSYILKYIVNLTLFSIFSCSYHKTTRGETFCSLLVRFCSLLITFCFNYFTVNQPVATNSYTCIPPTPYIDSNFNWRYIRSPAEHLRRRFFLEIVNMAKPVVIFLGEIHRGYLTGF